MLIRILNGVNLDLLGTREPHIYGEKSLKDLEEDLEDFAKDMDHISLEFFQSNDESIFLKNIDLVPDAYIINAGAWTHTSLAIADRLRAVGVPYVEVHLSNIYAREEYRKSSYLSHSALSVVSGGGFSVYRMALVGLLNQN